MPDHASNSGLFQGGSASVPGLRVLDALPKGILECPASALRRVLSGPTLFHLQGRRPQPLFVSVLLHGNEDSGWEAVRKLLAQYERRLLPRALSIFVGNVDAAEKGLRRLDRQPDYNRIWRGEGTPEHRIMREVVEQMRKRRPFASVDIHNNTGLNPHYACVNRLEAPFLYLATLFSRTVVFFTTPNTVQSRAFSELCPAVTVECGQAGHPHGVEHAREFLDACLHLDHFPDHPVPAADLDLFHTVAVVRVPADVSFGFGTDDTDIRFLDDLDRLNFCELPKGTALASVRFGAGARLEVRDEHGREVHDRYFAVAAGEIVTVAAVMPSMLTLDGRIIRQDCLCYLMERYQP